MKYIKLKVWILVASVVLFGFGYLFSGQTDFTFCSSIHTKCGNDFIFEFGLPFFTLMKGVIISSVLSFFIIKYKVYKTWAIFSLFFLIFTAIQIFTSPASCSSLICSKSDIASFWTLGLLVVVSIFVVISLIWSMVDHFKSGKNK